jgi:hypothetical protein
MLASNTGRKTCRIFHLIDEAMYIESAGLEKLEILELRALSDLHGSVFEC